jgi:hypothetical protein
MSPGIEPIDMIRKERGMRAEAAVAAPAEQAGGAKGKLIAFKALAAVFAAASWGGLFGVALVFAWIDNEDGGVHRVHFMGFGALYGVILTIGLLAQLWRAEWRISAFYQILAVALAAAVAGALATRGYWLIGVFVAIAWAVLLVLHPDRSGVLRPSRGRTSVPLAALALIGAVPWLWYASTMARFERTGLAFDPHVEQDHWTTMAAMAIGIVLVALLSALRFLGWRISAWSAGAGAILYGLISAVYPHRPGAEGTPWAIVAIAGGLVFIGVAEREARRTERMT